MQETERGTSRENRNLDRVTVILDALSHASTAGLRLADLVEMTELGKTTVHRILGGLMENRLVEQDFDSGRYFVGLRILGWAGAAKNRFSFARLAEPALDRISRRTQDTVYLVMRVEDEIVCLDSREGSFPIRVLTLDIGDRRPLGIGAGSLSILASLSGEEIERILATRADARAAYAFSESQLRAMIASARRDGFAYNNLHVFEGMENVTGMAGIGMAIRRRDGLPVAALHVTGITSRFDPPRRSNIVALLRDEIAALEMDLEPVLESIGTMARPRISR